MICDTTSCVLFVYCIWVCYSRIIYQNCVVMILQIGVVPGWHLCSNAFAKEIMQEDLSYFTLKMYSNMFQQCFETSTQQRIWTEVLQAGTKAKPDTSYEEKEPGHCQTSSLLEGARCSSVVRAFAHGAMGRRIDPSWWTHWAISRSSQCSTTGVTKAVVCIILSVGWCI